MKNYNIPIRPSCLQDITVLAEKWNIQKVILFGSRARGNYTRASDIDLAVKGGDPLAYYGDLEEEADTLLHFDVVNLQTVKNQNLLADIERDGIVLYEKI